jgi:hypothetical protein
MSRGWQGTAPRERLGEARPGAVLTAAAAVPLGAALTLAAGLLPAGARAVLGVALALLGVRLLGLAATAIGARMRPWTARALALGLLVAGAVVLAGVVAVTLDGGGLGRVGPGGTQDSAAFASPALGAGPAVALGLLVALAGAGLARAGGVAGWSTGPAAGAAAVVLAGAGAAVAVLAALGDGALGLDGDARAVVAVLLAAAATVALARDRRGDGRIRAAGVGAGALLGLVAGEASGLVTLVAGTGVSPAARGSSSEPVVAVAVAGVLGVGAALLVLAVRRRDVLVGVLPLGVLLQVRPAEPGVQQVGLLLVPAVLVLAAAAALAGARPAGRRIPRPDAAAGLGVALVVLLVSVAGAFPERGGPTGVLELSGGGLGVALACIVGLSVVAGTAWSAGGGPGAVAALAALLGLWVLEPFALLRTAAPDAFGGRGWIVGALAAQLVAGALVARRRPAPPVLAAFGLLTAGALRTAAYGFASTGERVDGILLTALTLGVSALALVAASAVALAGPAPTAGRAQALASGLAYGTLLFGLAAAGFVVTAASGGAAPATLAGGEAILGVALVAHFALGAALLAGSAARRPTAPVGALVALAAVATGLVAAAVGAGVAEGTADRGTAVAVRLLDPVLGFDASGTPLAAAGGGWPVLLGVLGGLLLGAGAWLESRRPAPPDAPVG